MHLRVSSLLLSVLIDVELTRRTIVDLSAARNVSLSYSVFFPADFDFVLGGKLPGLNGGHGGCSGGKSADSCFSTRLMVR